jgi:hypothetical protein
MNLIKINIKAGRKYLLVENQNDEVRVELKVHEVYPEYIVAHKTNVSIRTDESTPVGIVKIEKLDMLLYVNEAYIFEEYITYATQIDDLLEENFDAKVIQCDEKFVMSKRTKASGGTEYMVHHVVHNNSGSIGLEWGHYLSNFSDACLAYYELRHGGVKVEIPLTEEDLDDLKRGESFNWSFKTSCGNLTVETRIFNEENSHEA